MPEVTKLIWSIVGLLAGGSILFILIIWAVRTRSKLPTVSEAERLAELERIKAELKLESDQALADHFNNLAKKEGDKK